MITAGEQRSHTCFKSRGKITFLAGSSSRGESISRYRRCSVEKKKKRRKICQIFERPLPREELVWRILNAYLLFIFSIPLAGEDGIIFEKYSKIPVEFISTNRQIKLQVAFVNLCVHQFVCWKYYKYKYRLNNVWNY